MLVDDEPVTIIWARRLGCGFYEISFKVDDGFYNIYLMTIKKGGGFIPIESILYTDYPWREDNLIKRAMEMIDGQESL
jgi:hypothetical protein